MSEFCVCLAVVLATISSHFAAPNNPALSVSASTSVQSVPSLQATTSVVAFPAPKLKFVVTFVFFSVFASIAVICAAYNIGQTKIDETKKFEDGEDWKNSV